MVMRKTKIVCTIGPASESPEMIKSLIRAGMNVARLNFSHGSMDHHLEQLRRLRSCAEELGANLGVLLDIQGPKIRLGHIKGGKVTVNPGDKYILTTEFCEGDQQRAYVQYERLNVDLGPGNTIYIDDGLLEFKVTEVKGKDVHCEVVIGGELSSRKGVSLPGVSVDLPPLTEADIEHIKFGVKHGVDFIAASFVRKGSHVLAVKDIIKEAGGDIPVIAKIESDEGLQNIDEIIAAADGIMVARGDLGVEIPPEEVPVAQKMMIRKCNEAGKPVITATQMLDSMIRNPRATRAEIADVANAIFDGTDCVMLSGETAVGKYPVKAVELMSAIARRIERSLDYSALLDDRRATTRKTISDSISLSTCQTAQDLQAKAILCSTQSGATARNIAKYKPRSPILAICPNPSVVRQLALSWGVYPILVEPADNIEDMIDLAVEAAFSQEFVQSGDIVTITAGVKTDVPGSTNLLQVYEIQ